MRLLPREQDRLLLFLAAELARRRRGRGLALNQAEAVALIADEVCEAARDGRSYAEAEAAGYRVARPGRRGRGRRPRSCAGSRSRRCSRDGSRLLVLHDPITAPGRRRRARRRSSGCERDHALTVVNEGDVPVGVTSHFHFFEVNRVLRFDRAAAWGMRLAIAPGEKVFFDPGIPRKVFLLPFGGARVVRGHAGLADGPLDADGRAGGGAGARARTGVPRCLSRAPSGSRTPTSGSCPRATTAAVRTGSCRASATRCATASACGPSAAAWRSRSRAGSWPTRCSACGTRASASPAAASWPSAAPATPTRWTGSTSCSTPRPPSSTRPA